LNEGFGAWHPAKQKMVTKDAVSHFIGRFLSAKNPVPLRRQQENDRLPCGANRQWNPIETQTKRQTAQLGARGTNWPRYITDSGDPFQDQIPQAPGLFVG
jgi:hypothetical protein